MILFLRQLILYICSRHSCGLLLVVYNTGLLDEAEKVLLNLAASAVAYRVFVDLLLSARVWMVQEDAVDNSQVAVTASFLLVRFEATSNFLIPMRKCRTLLESHSMLCYLSKC